VWSNYASRTVGLISGLSEQKYWLGRSNVIRQHLSFQAGRFRLNLRHNLAPHAAAPRASVIIQASWSARRWAPR